LDLTRRTTVRTRKLDVDFEKYFEVALGIEDVRRSGVQGCAAKQIPESDASGRTRVPPPVRYRRAVGHDWHSRAGSDSPAECPGRPGHR